MQKPEGLFRPWYLTKVGKAKLKEFMIQHPQLSGGEARKEFRDKFPKFWKQSAIYHMSYVCGIGCSNHPEGGVQHRESTGKNGVREAAAERAKKVGKIAEGKVLANENEIQVDELLRGVLDYAAIHCKKSTQKEYEDKIKKHLKPALGQFRAVDLCLNPSLIRSFIAKKKTDNYSESSIDGMLSVLSLSFSLAENRLSVRPVIKKFNPQNARKAFFTDKEIDLLCQYLPYDVARPVRVMYLIGWRAWSEVFSRERRHLDLKTGKLVLEPGEAKNKEPRIFPLVEGSEVREILEEQEAETRRIEREKGLRILHLFHHEGEPMVKYYEARGYWKPTRYFLKAWKEACKNAGLVGRFRHDFRRSATRSFDSLPDHIAMRLTGHKSHKIFVQYKAITESDLYEAVKKMEKRRKNRSPIKVQKDD